MFLAFSNARGGHFKPADTNVNPCNGPDKESSRATHASEKYVRKLAHIISATTGVVLGDVAVAIPPLFQGQ